jgi:hypothetical protein
MSAYISDLYMPHIWQAINPYAVFQNPQIQGFVNAKFRPKNNYWPLNFEFLYEHQIFLRSFECFSYLLLGLILRNFRTNTVHTNPHLSWLPVCPSIILFIYHFNIKKIIS